MASFELPQINDNPDGAWGPSQTSFPPDFKFKDIPYTPFSKADKLGRYADWNDLTGDRGPNAPAAGTRTTGPNRRRDGQPTFGSGLASAFSHFQVEDEATFSLVDNKATVPRRGGPIRGRSAGRGGANNARGIQRGRGGFTTASRGGGAPRGGGRRGWRDWEKVSAILLHRTSFTD